MSIIPYHESFYVDPKSVGRERLLLNGDEFHHAVKVVRMRQSKKFAAVDGCGHWYECVVEQIGDESLQAKILSHRENVGEPAIKVILAQAVMKGSHFDWVVEKATEIGVSAIIPVLCKRAIVNPRGRTQRWRRLAKSAMKQCGRSIWPQIMNPTDFQSTLPLLEENDVKWIAHVYDDISERRSAQSNSEVAVGNTAALLIGPEGGFTPQEAAEAIRRGFTPISLGPRRLRSETAGLVTLVRLMTLLDDLGGKIS